MSFKPFAGDVAERQVIPEPLAFLNPTAPAAKDPAATDRQAQEGRRNALMLLNAIKVIAPLIGVLADKGAPAGSSAGLDAFKSMISASSAFAERMCSRLGVDSGKEENYWIRNSFERIAAESLRDGWGKHGLHSITILEGCLSTAAGDLASSPKGAGLSYWDMEPQTQVRLSMIRALAPVLSARQNGFDFFRKFPDKDLELLGEWIFESSARATEELAPKAAEPSSRAAIFSMMAQEAGTLVASCWKTVGKQTVEHLSKLSDAELSALLASDPNGLSLDGVKEMFERNFNKVVVLSGKLAAPGEGKIRERISRGASAKR